MSKRIESEHITEENYSYESYKSKYLFGALEIICWCEDRKPGVEDARKYKVNISVNLFGKTIFWAVTHSNTKGLNSYAEQVST